MLVRYSSCPKSFLYEFYFDVEWQESSHLKEEKKKKSKNAKQIILMYAQVKRNNLGENFFELGITQISQIVMYIIYLSGSTLIATPQTL